MSVLLRAAVALVVPAALLAGCSDGSGGDASAPVAVGKVVDGSVTLLGVGRESSVLVPDGEVTLAVDRPFDVLPASEWPGTDDLRAAAGADFVGVQWDSGDGFQVDPSEIMSGHAFTDLDPPRNPAGLTLVAGDTRIALPAATLGEIGDSDIVYAAVPEGAPLSIEVTYDGVTQTRSVGFDSAADTAVPAGPAARLYEMTAQRRPGGVGDTSASCPYDQKSFGDTGFGCGVSNTWSLPYVAGLGWAQPGATWLVADVYAIASEKVRRDGGSYATRVQDSGATLGGAEPATELTTRSAPADYSQTRRLVWSVPVADSWALDVTASFVATRDGSGTPKEIDFEGSGTVRVSATPHD